MSHESFWFRTLFKLKIYEVSGESFQRLFNDIACYRYASFQAVAPYGNLGDGGNDGWIPDENRYFQVYGKKASSETNLPYIVKKVTDDFDKIQENWGQVDHYHFVYNDRFDSAPSPIGQSLLALKNQYGLIEASVWDSRKLEQIFMELDKGQKESILLGGVPSDIPDFIDPRMVAELLKHLADNALQDIPLLKESAPDFYSKIELNGLKPPISDFLKTYFYQSQDVDDFLSTRDIGLKQSIATEMQEIYSESRAVIPNNADEVANTRYVWMMEKLIPKTVNHPHSRKAYREAAQVILANYFEICDIYEHPSTITSS